MVWSVLSSLSSNGSSIIIAVPPVSSRVNVAFVVEWVTVVAVVTAVIAMGRTTRGSVCTGTCNNWGTIRHIWPSPLATTNIKSSIVGIAVAIAAVVGVLGNLVVHRNDVGIGVDVMDDDDNAMISLTFEPVQVMCSTPFPSLWSYHAVTTDTSLPPLLVVDTIMECNNDPLPLLLQSSFLLFVVIVGVFFLFHDRSRVFVLVQYNTWVHELSVLLFVRLIDNYWFKIDISMN